MVQRKVQNKLSINNIQHVKSEKFLANMKISSSSSHQNQDGKSKVSDMKKKMKKSKSIKISDLETLQIQQSTPPSSVSRRTTQDGSPNYMKPTSS
ncbi:calmodulin binding protein PICBP [Trifolium repens]|nr:calmodulin binding protein PICBP [Trifolium repens]